MKANLLSRSSGAPCTLLRSWRAGLLLLGVAACAALLPGARGATRPPNIVYILADDLGYGDLGCYGQHVLTTPRIDRLAREGVRFTQHYAGDSVCTPSRSSLLTGKHTGHATHRDNPRFVDSYGFNPGEQTFGDVMRRAGYATGIAGKWHVGDRADTRDMAPYHGFDFAYCVGYPYPDLGVEHWPSHVFVNGVAVDIPQNKGAAHGRYMDDLYTDAALRFIEQNRSKPFLIYLAFQSVHAPVDADVSPEYARKPWPPVERRFATALQHIDQNVGRVLDALDQLGLRDNTIVFFTSDNGPHHEGGHDAQFFRSGGLLRGGKRDLYEGGIRVPLIVRWPGVVAPNTINRHVCAFWDMLPTFAEIGGAPVPSNLDGISFVPTLRGQPQRDHRYLYWETDEEGGKQAVRFGDWKAVRVGVKHSRDVPWELYNLNSDPGELHDVAAQHPDLAREAAAMAAEAHVPSPRTPLFPDEHATIQETHTPR